MTGKVKFKINTFQEHISNMTMKNVFAKNSFLYASEKAEWNEGLPVKC